MVGVPTLYPMSDFRRSRTERPRAELLRVATALAVAQLAACKAERVPPVAQTVTVGALQPVTTLDPRMVVLRAEIDLSRLMHDGLIALDSLGNAVPALATRWTTLADGRTVRFVLASGRRFHSGEAVTARAVVQSLASPLADQALRARSAPLLTTIEGGAAYLEGRTDQVTGLIAVDDSTVDIAFRDTTRDLTPLAAVRHGIRGSQATPTRPDGAGPWRLVRVDAPLTHFVLARTARRAGFPDTLQLRVVGTSELDGAFSRGELDCLPRAFATTRRMLAVRPDLIVNDIGPWYVQMIMLSPRQRAWDDLRARRALSLAIDRVGYTNTFAPRVGVPAGGLRNPIAAADAHRVPLAYDPGTARSAFAGVPGIETLVLRIAVPSTTPDDSVVGPQAALAVSLRAVGIRTRFVMTDRVLQALASGTVDLHLGGYTLDSQRDEPVVQLLIEGLLADSIAGRHRLPSLKDVEQSLQRDPSPRHRAAVIDTLDGIVRADLPLIPLWFAPGSTVSRMGVTGCTMEGAQIDQFVGLRRSTQ